MTVRLRLAARERQRALGELELAHATPTCDVAEARRAPRRARRAMTCPGSPLPQFVRPHSRHVRRAADGVERRPRTAASRRRRRVARRAARARRRGSRGRPRWRTGSAAGGRRSTTSGSSPGRGRRRCRRSGRSSVPASPGSRLTLVMRTIGWRAKPSARAQPPERSRPIAAALSRDRTARPRSTPSLDRAACASPARPRRPSRTCRGRPAAWRRR